MTILTNARWEQFAQRVASGESAAAAYRAIYKAAPKSAEAHGCRLIGNGKVRARIAELQAEAAKACVLTIEKRRELLSRFAQSNDEKTADRIRALELDARLAGELVEKAEVRDTTPREPLEDIRARVARARQQHARN